jgi:hypothetical protein
MGLNKRTIVAILAAFAASQSGWAATVRGRLLRGKGVAAGVAVTLRNAQRRTPSAYSGADGMYYIPNVKPGSYTLEVWVQPHKPPITFSIQVKEPESNVNPIYVQ